MIRQPNILWLSLESVRADHTPMYGYPRNTTPNLQKLCQREDTHVLHNGIAASNWTRPSTASMLTGTHYSTHNTGGRGARGTKLPDFLETLPELLADTGYHTALFSPAPQISADTGLDRGFEYYTQLRMQPSNFLPTGNHVRETWMSALQHLVEEPTLDPRRIKGDLKGNTNELLFRKIKRWSSRLRTTDMPFFAFAHIWSPHNLFQPPRRFRDSFVDNIDSTVKEAYDLAAEEYGDLAAKIANGQTFSPEEWDAIKAMYDAEIKYADHTLDRIIDRVEAVSNRDLIIVVTGDHGELFGEKGIISHKIILHDGVIRVPMVVVGIDDVVDGPDMMTQHIDLTYTLAAISDTVIDQFEGRDLRDEDRTYAISQRREWEFSDYTDINPEFDHSRFIKEPYTAVRTSTHKYIESSSHQILYDLPDETTDVSEDTPSIAKELARVIESESIEWSDVFNQKEATFDEATRDHLHDLGYLG